MGGFLTLLVVSLLVYLVVRWAMRFDWERVRPVAHFLRLTVWEDARYLRRHFRHDFQVWRFSRKL